MVPKDDLQERRAKLSPEKQAMLEKRLRGKSGSHTPAPHIPRRSDQGPAPLSFAQERLWFLEQLVPGNTGYIIPIAVRLTGRLHMWALMQALNTIVARHETLRTTFATIDGQTLQIIGPARPLPLPVIDLSTQPANLREDAVRQIAGAELRQPFDLTQGPLLRAHLLRLDASDHVLLLTMHHIISDGWSLKVLIQEMMVLYKAYQESGVRPGLVPPDPLMPLPIQYADFAVWQCNQLQGANLDSQLSYWRERLAEAPPTLELPLDRPRPAVQTFAGAIHTFELPAALIEAIRGLNQREGLTLFMTLLGAFDALLARYTGQTQVVIGTSIANRHYGEMEGLIGFFVNSLVMHTDLSGDPSFRELLTRVLETALGAYAHQDLPFEKLVEALRPKRDPSRHPIFQVMFTLQNIPMPAIELPGLTLKPFAFDSRAAQFDLSLTMVKSTDTITGTLEYNTDLFEPTTIARMAEHFLALLEHAVAHPETRLSQLPLWTEAERHRLLTAWNATQVDYPLEICLHELIEIQARRSPDAIALVFEDQQQTYQALFGQANHLASRLQQFGVGPEVPVGLYMERSPNLVIGLLGILMAGGAYVPLDPTYPADRLAWILRDAQVGLLLTQQHLAGKLPQHHAEVLCLDDDRPWMGERGVLSVDQSPAPGPQRPDPDALAYVIYTSGSTGAPKGAMNSHRGIVNRLLWMQDAYSLTANDRVLQKTPYNFDVSVWEFFWPLLTGATLVLAIPGGHQDPSYLVRLIAQQQITTLHFVPSMLQVFLAEPDLTPCRSLQRVICSGEALPPDLQERFFNRLSAALYNLYGPTEAAVDVTHWTCQAAASSVPIGHPVANTQIYLLDRHMQPVPVGMPGELYIGGVQLARGYLGRPDLTGERFVPNPFLKIEDRGLKIEDSHLTAQERLSSILYPLSSTRLYRTGDLCRYRADGAIEYLGRIDYQVKLRGFRIELGEIETILSQHPAVQTCIVMMRQDTPSEQRLVAYVVPDQAPSAKLAPSQIEGDQELGDVSGGPGSLVLGSGELRNYLSKRLPEYMVPSAFVILEALPLTPNGKADRRALSAPITDRPTLDYPFVAPRIPAEERLVAIWRELLHVDQIGIYDNFFDLGGHSLLLTQLASRIRQIFQVEIPLRYP